MKNLGLILGTAISLGLVGVGVYALVPTGNSVNGLMLEGVDVSNKSKEELEQVIKEEVNKASVLTIVDDKGQEIKVPLKDLGISINESETLGQLYDYGYESDIQTYVWHRLITLWETKKIHLVYNFNEPIMMNYLHKLSKTIGEPAQDGAIVIKNGQIEKIKAKVGSQLDIQETYNLIKTHLEGASREPIKLVIKKQVEPKVKDSDVAQLNSILGVYSTEFNPGDTSRSHNIEIASTKINGTLLQPNEVFSFNEVVGERTSEAGFDDAPVFVGGKLVPGIGGGICQVSSTLFNTALLSGMEIVERETHFAPVSYIPKGRDATVAYGYIDFKFKNTYTHPVYIISRIEGGTLEIYIVGNEADTPESVEISTGNETIIPHKTNESIDPNSDKDVVETGHDGLSMITKRTIRWANGRSSNETFESVYEPLETIIIKGGKKPKDSKEETQKSTSSTHRNQPNSLDKKKE